MGISLYWQASNSSRTDTSLDTFLSCPAETFSTQSCHRFQIQEFSLQACPWLFQRLLLVLTYLDWVKWGVPTRHFGVRWFDWVAHGTQRDTYAYCLFYFRARVSLSSSRWPGTHCIGQTDLELRDQRLPPQVLELEVCTPTPGLRVLLWGYYKNKDKELYRVTCKGQCMTLLWVLGSTTF